MTYRILIEQLEEVIVIKKEYQKVAETGNKRDNGPDFDYVSYETQVVQNTKILEASLQELNLNEVIKALFKINEAAADRVDRGTPKPSRD